MGWSLAVALTQSWRAPLNFWGVLACMGGICAAYAWDGLLDAPPGGYRWGWRHTHFAVSGAALFAAILFHRQLLLPVLGLGVLGFLYIPLKRHIPKNLLTAAAWTAAAIFLPFDGVTLTAAMLGAAGAIFLLIYAAAVLCDVPDVAEDRSAGVCGLAPKFGETRAAKIAALMALASAVLAAAAGVWMLTVPALIFAVLGFFSVGWLARASVSRFAVDALLVLPGVLVLLNLSSG